VKSRNPISLLPRNFHHRAIAGAIVLALSPLAASQPAFAQEVFSQFATKECQPDNRCELAFPAVAAQKNFTIHFVSCNIVVSPKDTEFTDLVVGVGFGTTMIAGGIKNYLAPLSLVGSNTTRKFYSVSTAMLALVPSGKNAIIRIGATRTPTLFKATCTVSGTLDRAVVVP
jgi:hypothetical protein